MKPIRTALFAPGSKERVMMKALESGANAVILDLEDSVPVAAKAEARGLVGKAIEGAAAAPSRPGILMQCCSPRRRASRKFKRPQRESRARKARAA